MGPPQCQDEDLVEQVIMGLIAQPDPMARYRTLSRAQEMYEAVTRRIAAERARAVAEMKQTGLSYGEIAKAIGFTRARAQQLVERAGSPTASKTTSQRAHASSAPTQLTGFLQNHLHSRGWPREPTSMEMARSMPVPPLMAQRYTTEQLATELFAEPAFRALHLGTWRRSPDAQLIASAIEALSPPPYRQDAALLVDAVTMAAQLQQDDGRQRAVAAGAVLAFLGAVSLTGRN